MVLPVFIMFLLGIVDAGRYMWFMNSAEKATQVGARMAAVTDMVPSGLYSADYSTTLGQGASITTASFGAAQCAKPGTTVTCSCATNPCPTLTPFRPAAFDAVVTRMSQMNPLITGAKVTIRYENSGLGYAGNPNGADVSPIITVTATNLTFTPLVFQFFGASLTMPDISASLTMEDGAGTTFN